MPTLSVETAPFVLAPKDLADRVGCSVLVAVKALMDLRGAGVVDHVGPNLWRFTGEPVEVDGDPITQAALKCLTEEAGRTATPHPLEELFPGVRAAQGRLRKRGFPMAAEHVPPTGQAAYWYMDVIQCVPRSGRDVARQLARLCKDDSEVTIPWRSLADAVGVRDRGGRTIAYAQRGVQVLVEAGWLKVETVGSKRAAKTTFSLMPGERGTDWASYASEDDVLEEVA